MDFKVKDKGWTRNIHQKFDAVCQEGTIKYVENQVQTLGETVKGFCSNVLQDVLPSALSNPVNHNAETVPQEGKFVTKTVTNLKEKYADTDTKLPPALSNPVNGDAESVPQKEKHATQNYNKPVIILKEKYADIASKRISTESVHHVPPFTRLNNVRQTMPMPTEGYKKPKSLFPSARDESALVNDNVKSSVIDIGSGFGGLVAKEKSLSEDSNGINDETSLVLVTENDYHNHEITDEAVSAAVVDSVRDCSYVKERTSDTCFDDCHCKNLGTSQSSKVECSSSCGCQVVETTLISSTSSLSNDSYYQSEFCETENFVYEDSFGSVSDTSDVDSSIIGEVVSANGSSGHKHERHCNLSQTEDLMSVVEVGKLDIHNGHADEPNIDIADPNMKTIDLSEKTKLDESCVIVDNKLLGAASCRPRRHRSYKQIIKDAYTSTKRLTKEYELLGIWYGDIDKESVQHKKHSMLPSSSGITPGNKQLLTKDLGDSEWELL